MEKDNLNILLSNIKSYPLSNFDIEEVEKTKVKSLDEIKQLDHLDQLLDRKGRGIILLQNISDNEGHWASILRYPKKPIVELYEGYGLKKEGLIDLDPDINHLFDLIEKSGYKLILNNKKYQSKSNNINTCGRYALLRILAHKLNLNEFNNMINKISKNMKVDDIISIISYLILGK